MSNQEASEMQELREKIEELEDDVERKTGGRNQMELEAFDLRVVANSEEASMEELAEICSEEMDSLTKRALIGEYQELEEQNLFGSIFGEG